MAENMHNLNSKLYSFVDSNQVVFNLENWKFYFIFEAWITKDNFYLFLQHGVWLGTLFKTSPNSYYFYMLYIHYSAEKSAKFHSLSVKILKSAPNNLHCTHRHPQNKVYMDPYR